MRFKLEKSIGLILLISFYAFTQTFGQSIKSLPTVDSVTMKELLSGPTMQQVIFKQVKDTTLKIYYVKPTNISPKKRCAAIVCIHGGGWTSGGADVFFSHARYFALRGAVGFSIEYRLIKHNGPLVTDCIADCKSAIRYIRVHARELNVDPNKIVVLGDSAGGHLAACMGTIDGFDDPSDNIGVSSKANAMVLCNPGVDLTDPAWVKIVIGGVALAKNPAPGDLIPTPAQLSLAKQVSPLFNVHKNEPPTLIMHGLDDKIILPVYSISFRDSMLKAGNRCDLELLPQTRHAFIIPNYTATEQTVVNVICKVDMFLTSLGYFKGPPLLRTGKELAWLPKGSKH